MSTVQQMPSVAERLGYIAAKYELLSRNPAYDPATREYYADLAKQYRAAQLEEMKPYDGNANVLIEQPTLRWNWPLTFAVLFSIAVWCCIIWAILAMTVN
jgi:hypothetical protein